MQQSILWPRYNVNTPLVPSWSNSPCLKMCYCSWSIDTNSEGKSWDKTEFTATEIWRISVLVKCDQQQGFICDSCFWMSFQSDSNEVCFQTISHIEELEDGRSCSFLQGVADAAGNYFESQTRFTVIISSAVSSVSFITFVVCSVTHCGHSSIDPVQQDSSGKWLFRDTLSNY